MKCHRAGDYDHFGGKLMDEQELNRKREEIREGIRGELDMTLPLDCPQRETRLIRMTNDVYEKLHKQGVVLKVDNETPEGYRRDSSWRKVEPLIEE